MTGAARIQAWYDLDERACVNYNIKVIEHIYQLVPMLCPEVQKQLQNCISGLA